MNKIPYIIASYKARHSPYTERKDYRHYLEGLASELHALKPAVWSCDPFNRESYTYLMCNPLKKSKGPQICPSGFVIKTKFEIFYVGKGKNARAYAHLKEARNLKIRNHKVNTIRSIWAAGREPKILVMASRVSDFMAMAFEIDLIAGIGRKDLKLGPLTNVCDGGEGPSGYVPTAESNERRSASLKGRILPQRSISHNEAISSAKIGKKILRTKEHNSKIGLAHKGKPKSLESRKKISASRQGSKASAETVRRQSERQKVRFEVEGVLYKGYTESAPLIGLSVVTLRKRIRSNDYPTYQAV